MANRSIAIFKLPRKTVKGHSNNTTNTKEGTDVQKLKKIKGAKLQFYRDSVARVTIACQTLVLVAHAKLTQVTVKVMLHGTTRNMARDHNF